MNKNDNFAAWRKRYQSGQVTTLNCQEAPFKGRCRFEPCNLHPLLFPAPVVPSPGDAEPRYRHKALPSPPCSLVSTCFNFTLWKKQFQLSNSAFSPWTLPWTVLLAHAKPMQTWPLAAIGLPSFQNALTSKNQPGILGDFAMQSSAPVLHTLLGSVWLSGEVLTFHEVRLHFNDSSCILCTYKVCLKPRSFEMCKAPFHFNSLSFLLEAYSIFFQSFLFNFSKLLSEASLHLFQSWTSKCYGDCEWVVQFKQPGSTKK